MEIPIIGDYYNSGTISIFAAMDASLLLEFSQSKNKIMLFPNSILVKIQQIYHKRTAKICQICSISMPYLCNV